MRRTAAALVALACTFPLAACAAEWRADAAASRLEFVATFERAPAPGRFKAFDARVRLDPARPEEARLDVDIDVTSADMGNRDVNRAIRDPEWFDVGRFPHARFSSSSVRRTGVNRYVARGTLELKGMRNDVDVPFEWTDADGVPTMTGEITLSRASFRIGTGEWARTDVIGPDVVVRFRLKFANAS